MLRYSNASSIEKSRRYLVIKGGACLVALARERGRQLHSRTGQQQRRSRGLPKRRGGRNNKYSANISKTTQDMTKSGARCVLTQYGVMLAKGEIVRESIPGVPCFRAKEPEGESCEFDMLGVRGGRTGCISGFVSSF